MADLLRKLLAGFKHAVYPPFRWLGRMYGRALSADNAILPDVAKQDERFAKVFSAEIEKINPDLWTELQILRPELKSDCRRLTSIYAAIKEHETGLSALCISGGGIRSASFALGVLQSLKEYKMLEEFDYISTVSGGGYIGGFLSAWRKQVGGGIPPALTFNRHGNAREAPELVGLRAGSYYLTPRLGILSADTWTALVLIVRNLLLNWAIFLPFFMAVLLLPWVCKHFLQALPQSNRYIGLALVTGMVLLCIGLCFASFGRRRGMGVWLTEPRFLLLVLLPVSLASMAFTASARCLVSGAQIHVVWRHLAIVGSGLGAITYAACWIVAGFLVARTGSAPNTSASDGRFDKDGRPLHEHWLCDLIVWTFAGSLAGAALSDCVAWLASLGPIALTIGGSASTMLALFAGEIVYVAMRSYDRRGDMDREWLARAAGWLAVVAVAWSALSTVALLGPQFITWTDKLSIYARTAIAAAGGLPGVFTVIMGWSAKTAATDAAKAGKLSLTQWTTIAGVVFSVTLAVGISTLDVTAGHAVSAAPRVTTFDMWLARSGAFRQCITDLLAVLLLCCFSLGLSWFVNINRFSLHALYRNRLVRTFLGSARKGSAIARTPDPFTGFDPTDNPRMHDLCDLPKPFHIINVALNVVSTTNLAWQERKAVSFTISPLRVGCPLTDYTETNNYASAEGGITLGTAMAISGAAVSPNMGYHTSPLISFLLMLFNVRLGCWLGNPARSSAGQEGPCFGLLTMLQELANMTTATNRWIYLSDGGHFDNLGLYEMLRRRCRLIVVSDAGCDPKASLADLGDSLRKASIDFGVTVEFDRLMPIANQRPPLAGPYCWVADVNYAEGGVGQIVYLRPTYTALESADIRSYAESDPAFPHDSTTEQWFGERQFEAYRALGQRQMKVICSISLGQKQAGLPALKRLVEQAKLHVASYFKPPSGGNSAPLCCK